MNLRLYLFVSDIIEKNDGGRWVQDFLVLPQGIGSHSLVASDLVYLVCAECLLMIKPMAVVFVLLEFDATLDDGCGIW